MINDLIEKLEAATEGSRALDGLIAQYLGLPHGPWEKVYIKSRSIAYGDEKARYYTTSLDAAMTLTQGVPFIEMVIDGPEGETNVVLWSHTHSDGRQKELARSYAATAPLALCIAALKARSQS